MRRFLLTTTAALLLTAGTALAQADWDSDGDGLINEQEFTENAPYDETFGNWDEDGDGMLSEDEFASGVYDTYDEDGDGYWSEDEYSEFEDDDWF